MDTFMMNKEFPSIKTMHQAKLDLERDLEELEEKLEQAYNFQLGGEVEIISQEIVNHKHDLVILEAYFATLN